MYWGIRQILFGYCKYPRTNHYQKPVVILLPDTKDSKKLTLSLHPCRKRVGLREGCILLLQIENHHKIKATPSHHTLYKVQPACLKLIYLLLSNDFQTTITMLPHKSNDHNQHY